MTKSWKTNTIVVIAATLLTAIIAMLGLTNHALWDDEAHTAIYARNLLRFGRLTAWDGRNLIAPREGAELDRNLVNVSIPPLQFYLAAIGIAALGDGTFAARIPFVVLGMATIVILAIYTLALMGPDFPWSLPSCLLALNPVFLLYIRNCRYFAPAMLLTLVMYTGFIRLSRSSRRLIISGCQALIALPLMILNHQLITGCSLAALPVHCAFKRYRTAEHVVFIVGVYLVAAIMFLIPSRYGIRPSAEVYISDPTPALTRFLTLTSWNLKGLALHEFFPVALLFFLGLPYVLRRAASLKNLAASGWLLTTLGLTYILITSALVPTSVHLGIGADMRYLMPLIPLGAVISAIALVLIGKQTKLFAVVLFVLAVFTNVLHLGYLEKTEGYRLNKGVSSTLFKYFKEILAGYESSTDALINYLDAVPADTRVLISPSYYQYPLMFYRPDLLYCCQLSSKKDLSPELRRELPEYLFWETADVELAIIGDDPPWPDGGALEVIEFGKRHSLGNYTYIGSINTARKDFTRPDLPWHAFSDSELGELTTHGFYVARKIPDRERP